MLSVMQSTLMLMYSPNNFNSTIIWICFTTAPYHTPTSSFLTGVILKIGSQNESGKIESNTVKNLESNQVVTVEPCETVDADDRARDGG